MGLEGTLHPTQADHSGNGRPPDIPNNLGHSQKPRSALFRFASSGPVFFHTSGDYGFLIGAHDARFPFLAGRLSSRRLGGRAASRRPTAAFRALQHGDRLIQAVSFFDE